jgi:hypothetical protein
MNVEMSHASVEVNSGNNRDAGNFYFAEVSSGPSPPDFRSVISSSFVRGVSSHYDFSRRQPWYLQ